jgi:circadian clock protein KaiC
MTKIRALERITTGVPGLDFLLDGGLFETGVYIVQGGAGCGKTILSNQVCFHQAEQGRRAVYYTLLTESHDRMMGFIHALAFFDPAQVSKGVNYVSGFKLLESEGLPGVVRSVRDIMSAQRPTLFVIDGVVSAEEIAPSDTVFKKFLHEIQMAATMFRCTVLMLTNTEAAKRLQAEHTMVDGIIELRFAGASLKTQRSIEISKLRGAAQKRGPHTLEISSAGMRVHPRIETVLANAGALRRPTTRARRGFGIAPLDAMLHGGLLSSTNTMLLGASGTCKTLLGMHLLDAGCAAGEKGLMFTFYEHREELVEKARALGMNGFADGVERGDVRIEWESSVEANVDHIGNRLVRAFDTHRPARVFIDGLHGFEVTADPEGRIQDFFAAISDYFTAQETTVLFSAETKMLVGDARTDTPFANASRLCQNIILTRHVELGDSIQTVLSILKLRDSDFDRGVRLVTVGARGVEVGATTAWSRTPS